VQMGPLRYVGRPGDPALPTSKDPLQGGPFLSWDVKSRVSEAMASIFLAIHKLESSQSGFQIISASIIIGDHDVYTSAQNWPLQRSRFVGVCPFWVVGGLLVLHLWRRRCRV
jgi:hypothetical protein